MKTYPNPNPLFRFGAASAAMLAVLCFAVAPEAKAQYQITTMAGTIVENFSGLSSTTSGIAFSGDINTNTNTSAAQRNSAWSFNLANNGTVLYRANYTSGSPSSGVMAMGNSSNNDFALGAFGTGSYAQNDSNSGNVQHLTAQFQNTSGSVISSLVLSYVAEQWARGGTRLSGFTVSYSTTSATAGFATISGAGAVANNLNASAPTSASFITGGTSQSINNSGNGYNVSGLNVANGSSIWLRWSYGGGTGSGARQAMGVDDISVTFNGAPPPSATDYYWTGDGLALGGTGTWNNALARWSATNSPITPIVWDSSKKAIFAGTAGTVTVDTVSANAGIQFSTTGYSLTNGTLTLGGASIGVNAITTDAAVATTIGTTLAGTAGMTKAGAGTLVLSGANTLEGGIAINAGGLSISSAGNLGAAGNDVSFGGGTLVVTDSLTTGSGTDFTGSGTINIAPSEVLQVDGIFNLSATTLNNTGTLDLNGATRSVGALTFGAAATIDASGAISATSIDATGLTSGTATINNAIIFSSGDKNLNVGTGGELVIDGDISGLTAFNRIVKLGEGTLVVNGGNTGGFRLGAAGTTNGGTLVVAAAAGIGENQFQFNYGTLEASTPMTITNTLSIGGREPAAAVVGGTSAIEFTGAVSWFNGGSNTFVQVNNQSTMSGVISSAAGDVDLVFGGAGTLTMSGSSANTFTNDLVVTNTLTVNLNKSATTTAIGGNVTVNTGATLLISASGQVADTSVVTLSGGTISRASGVSETFGDLNLTAASTLDYVGGSAGTLQFEIYEGDAAPDFVLTLNNFGQGNKLIFANDLSAYIDASFVGTSFANSYFAINGMAAAGFTSAWDSGNSTFTITAIPEPSTYAAAAGLLGLMLWPARRRIVRDAQRIIGLRRPMRDRLARLRA